MKRIYEITYEERYPGIGWTTAAECICGGVDPLKVVEQLQKKVLKRRYSKSYRDEDTNIVTKCTGFRLKEIRILAEANR